MASAHTEAQARYRAGDLAGAKALLETALRESPGHWAVHHDLGLLLRQLGERAAAEFHVRSSLALAPAAAVGWTTVGLIEGDAGAFPRARRAVDRARIIAPDEPSSLIARADLADDGELSAYADRIAAMLRRSGLPDRQRARLLHTLGRLCDRAGDVDRAFAAISAAHAIRRRERPYDPAEDSAFFASVMAVCDRDWWRRPGNDSAAAVRPIFIVGMPRSGTTLLEQMLSRHPSVDAGGESLALQTVLAVELPQRLGSDFPECLALASPADWAWAAQRYLALTAGRRRDAAVFTDKLPANFLLVGPILKMFPDARVLNTVREPLDNALSCYLTDFAHGQNFSADLDHLGHHFSLYRRLMTHWLSFDDRRLRQVSFEDLVTAPEAELRAVLAHCGLEWHPDCLAFGQSDHATNTASWRRVRGPLDPRRIGNWRRYDRHLGALAGRLTSRSGEAGDILRRALAWQPGLPARAVDHAEHVAAVAAPAESGRILARMPAIAGRDVRLLSRAAALADRCGRPDLGLRLSRRAARFAPELAALHLNLAVALGRRGNPTAACRSLHRALALSPAQPEAWANLGGFLAVSAPQSASVAHRRAVAIAPAVADFHASRGVALLRVAGGEASARCALRRALALDPAHRPAAMSLHRLRVAGGREADGLPLLDRLRCTVPLDGEVHYERGCALRDAGQDPEAAEALRRAIVLQPEHGTWRHVLDALLGRTSRGGSARYARELFDQYAGDFDRHLTERLHYRTPAALAGAVAKAGPRSRTFARVLDLGCGTGLMGAALRERFDIGHLTGIDVSGGMLDRLREKGGYDVAEMADVHDFLERDAAPRYDLIVAADVLGYLGPLDRLMAGAARALADGGLLAVSVEQGDGAPFELRRNGRYAHRRDYVETTAAAAGLRVLSCEPVTLRQERGEPVAGLLLVLAAG